jgi:orotidine-5'-phosphate decarboxylase
MNEECGLIVNSSRGIIYAGHDEHFAEAARQAARDVQQQMKRQLELHQLI